MYPDDQTHDDDTSAKRNGALSGVLEKELEHMILAGDLQPGERLNEIHLSARFGTSRGPLREALRGLQAKGLVVVVKNRGMFVKSISPSEAMEIYDLRAAVFGLAGRLLADMVTDVILDRLNDFLEHMDDFANARDFDNYYRVNLAFHSYLIEAPQSELLVEHYQSLVNKLHLCRARGLVQAGGLSVSNREHREMVDALASGDRYRAQEAFFRHVDRSKSRFLSTVSQNDTDI
jgi:DNA-binding GntR family transcriptional regulator